MHQLIQTFSFQSDKIINSLSKEEKVVFFEEAKLLFFKKGQLIFYDEGIPTGVFLLKSGKAKIFKTNLYGKEQIFYIYKKGDLLGYHALLCNENYMDSCQSLEDCEVLFINSRRFYFLLEQMPDLKTLLIQNMSHEFGVMVNIITVLGQKSLRERLALFLLILNDRYDEENINLPREDLANIVGTARESLGRLLKEFREDNLINIQQRRIALLDIPKLQNIAGF